MAHMAFAEHHDMIEALPADRTDQRRGFVRVNAETSGGFEYRWILTRRMNTSTFKEILTFATTTRRTDPTASRLSVARFHYFRQMNTQHWLRV